MNDDQGIMAKAMGFFTGKKGGKDPLSTDEEDAFLVPGGSSAKESSVIARALAGDISAVSDYFFPPDIIGGCCPRIVGSEQDIVWNAAAEAVDSERIHVVWQASGERIWYLVVRSSDMAQHPGTWCPFASLLPGMKDSGIIPSLYTHYSDESATMMTVLPDALQIHRGTSSVIRAKAERMARELGGVKVIELVPEFVEKLAPVPWFSLSLFEERARRVLAAASVGSALVVAAVALMIWIFAVMASMGASIDLKAIHDRSGEKAMQLLKTVQTQRASPMREQIAKFSEINDGLLVLNGYLDVYQVAGNKVLWRAYVPENVTSDRISELGGQTLETNEKGVLIGNSRETSILDKGRRRR